jgi:hypothetical protein
MNLSPVVGQMETLQHLRELIDHVPARLRALPSEKVERKPAANAWSPKQELGHLLDPAASNHQRIVRIQLEEKPAMPGYDGDRWVDLQRYQDRDWDTLVGLWKALNQQLLAAAESTPDEAWSRTCTIANSEPLMLKFVFDDYVAHMVAHLLHIGVEIDGQTLNKTATDKGLGLLFRPVATGHRVMWSSPVLLGRELRLLLLACVGTLFLFQFLGRIHAATATLAAAVAGSFILAVIQPVVVGELLAGLDVANAGDEHSITLFVGLAVGIARVIHKHGYAMAIDHNFAIADAKQIGKRTPIVSGVAFRFTDALASVFHQFCSFGNVFQCETTGGMNV